MVRLIQICFHFIYIAIKRRVVNRRYKRNPARVGKQFYRKFEVYLKSGMSPLTKKYFGPGQVLGDVTVAGYGRMIKKVVKDLNCIFPTKDQVYDYMITLKEQGKSYSHRTNTRNLMIHLMAFHGEDIEMPRERKPKQVIKRFTTVDDVQKLLGVARTVREKAIICTLAFSGIRIAEMSALILDDIDFARKTILVRQGKGSKDRIVNITQECAAILEIYTGGIRNKTKPIFSKPQIIRRTLKRMRARTDIEKKISPHDFRRGLATSMLFNGCDVLSISRQLGHSDPRTTLRYTQLTDQAQKERYEHFVPNYFGRNTGQTTVIDAG